MTDDPKIDLKKQRRKTIFWRVVTISILVFLIFIWTSDIFDNKNRDHIAKLSISGLIYENDQYNDPLASIKENDNANALILNINSPGGTAAASEILFTKIREIGEVKPVVAICGTLCASGGYVVALASDYIIALNTSLTGSVGVIVQTPEIEELLKKLGISVNEIKSGKLKGEPSFFKSIDTEVKKSLQDSVEKTNRWFLDLVAERRKISVNNLKDISTGKVYNGVEALEKSLVDGIGHQTEAIEWLNNIAGIRTNTPIIDYRISQETGLVSFILQRFGLKLNQNNNMIGLTGLLLQWQP